MDAGRLFGGDLLVVLLHNTITRFPHLALVSFLLCVSHPSVLLFAWFLRIVAVVSTLVLSLETRTQKSKKLTSRGKRFFKK